MCELPSWYDSYITEDTREDGRECENWHENYLEYLAEQSDLRYGDSEN